MPSAGYQKDFEKAPGALNGHDSGDDNDEEDIGKDANQEKKAADYDSDEKEGSDEQDLISLA